MAEVGDNVNLNGSCGVIRELVDNDDGDTVVIVEWLDGPEKGRFAPIGHWDLRPAGNH